MRYTLKTPYRDGTTHVILEPEDFIARLAVLVPKPRAHLVRYRGVFAPNSRLRAQITPGRRGKKARTAPAKPRGDEVGASPRRAAMTWAQRLKRVFRIDIQTCLRCGGRLRIIASIEEPALIERILDHLGRAEDSAEAAHPTCAPPHGRLPL